MKTINNYLKPILVILYIIVLASCGEDEVPTKESFIGQNWVLEKVTFNGQSENVTPYSMVFKSDKNFVFTIPPIPDLPSNGKWTFVEKPTMEIILNNVTKLKATTLEANKMVLEYNYKNHKEGDVTVVFFFKK